MREYWKLFKPKEYLFEGQEPGKPYSSRSLQKVFEHAVEKAGIKKKVTVHSLRHAFATHLLEQGTDLRYTKLIGACKFKDNGDIHTCITAKNRTDTKSD